MVKLFPGFLRVLLILITCLNFCTLRDSTEIYDRDVLILQRGKSLDGKDQEFVFTVSCLWRPAVEDRGKGVLGGKTYRTKENYLFEPGLR
jgi:hypothetical protein